MFSDLEKYVSQASIKCSLDYSKNPATSELIHRAEAAIGLSFGPEMRSYLLRYGRIYSISTSLLGVDTVYGINSDMIIQTRFLHKKYPQTLDFIVLEIVDRKLWVLSDDCDNIIKFYVDKDSGHSPIFGNLSVSEYILDRIQMGRNDKIAAS